MTKKAQVAWIKWTTFLVVCLALMLGLSLLSQHFWNDANTTSLIRGFTTALVIFGAQVAAHFAVRLVPGTQAPQLNTETIERSTPSEAVENGELTVKSSAQARTFLRVFAVLIWVLSLTLLAVFTGLLIPVEDQRGREWGLLIVLVFAAGGLFLWFCEPSPTLKIDARGVGIGKKLIAWREISDCEIHTQTDELGETSSVALHLKNRFGVAIGTVVVAPTEDERQRLMPLLRAYLKG